jgi:hypothetical protein
MARIIAGSSGEELRGEDEEAGEIRAYFEQQSAKQSGVHRQCFEVTPKQ